MRVRSLVFGSFILGSSISGAVAANIRILVIPLDDRQETSRCAKALVDSTNMITDKPIEAKVISFDEYDALKKYEDAGWQNKKTRSIVIELDQRSDGLALHGIPFAFTDAAHYLAYLQSPLLARLDANRGLGETILAYGGFSQLFSRVAAVTMPKHFYHRRISGDAQGLLVYHEFGGEMGIALPAFMMTDLPAAFQHMESGHALYDIVEAPLTGAYDAGAAQTARFLSLASASVMSISFKGGTGYFPQYKMTAWQRAAALKCSKENFAAELEVLDKFKKAGVQVAPFDRAALVETSRRLWLEEKHPDWTIADFDELASLAAPIGKSPSQIVASLPAKRKAAALRLDEEAKKERTDVAREAPRPRGNAIDAILKTFQIRLATETQSLPLPSPPSGKTDRPKVISKWWSRSNYDQVANLTSTLAEAISNCANCRPSAVFDGWNTLARANFALGNTAAATAALDPVFAAPKPNEFNYLTLLRMAASIGDKRAKAPILEICGKVVATASTNVKKDKFPFDQLVRCVYLYSDLDEDTTARDALKIAASFADVHADGAKFAELAKAQWYVGNIEGSRQSLEWSLRLQYVGPTPRWPWPLLRLSEPVDIEANRPFFKIVEKYLLDVSDALYPVLAGSPQREYGRYQEWAEYMADALSIESQYEIKDRQSSNLQKLQDAMKGLQGEERKRLQLEYDEFSTQTRYLDDPAMTSTDPETRLFAVGLAVAHFASFAVYLR